MTREQLEVVVRAAMEAAVVIAKVTPNSIDDKIAEIARAIVDQVFGLFGAGPEMDEQVSQQVAYAAQQIRVNCEDCFEKPAE